MDTLSSGDEQLPSEHGARLIAALLLQSVWAALLFVAVIALSA